MIFSNLALAWREILANLLRSALTLLGIVIGVGAVIAMVTVGQGASLSLEDEVESLGQNVIFVFAGTESRGGRRVRAQSLELGDAQAVRTQAPSVRYVSAIISTTQQVVFGNQNTVAEITGVELDYFTLRNWGVTLGRLPSAVEMRSGRPVCVLGTEVREELFEGANPIGESIRFRGITCEVIGVLAAKGGSFGNDQDSIVAVPLSLTMRRITGNPRRIFYMMASASSEQAVDAAKSEIAEILRERRDIRPGEEDDFTIRTQEDIAEFAGGLFAIVTLLLSAIAGISLLVGGIGIMNIMLVSVTERTREIGIRLAIGAQERDILIQFLTEAAVLCAIGGLMGVIVGYGLGYIINSALGFAFAVDIAIALIAVGVSAAIGLVFGLFPAWRAARLDPIDALRHE